MKKLSQIIIIALVLFTAGAAQAEWSALGAGMDNSVYALAFDSFGNLYAGGSFTTAGGVSANKIAKWDGSTWIALGSGMNGDVFALAFDSAGNLYAGGSFTSAGGVANTIRIAKWNGSVWSALGSGMNGDVFALAFDSAGNLYVGGWFTTADGVSANRIAKWNGSAWSALGTGMNDSVNALAFDSAGNLYAGGRFTSAGGVADTGGIAKWNGSAWSALETGFPVYYWTNSIVFDNSGNLYVGISYSPPKRYTPTQKIAKWNGSAWSALGTGMNNSVHALAIDSAGNLYAGGKFTSAGGIPSSRIAKWNGSAWSALGSGMDFDVNELAVDSAGNLYTGGQFTTAGGIPSSNIAKWIPPVIGYGSTPAPGSTISVGSALVGSPVSSTLAVSETGNTALTVSSLAIGGTNPADFSVTPSSGFTINDGGVAQNVTIQCTPSVAGARTATLTVTHDATGSPATYTLNCTGTTAVTAGVTLTGISNITGSTVLATGNATGTGIGERGFYWWIPPTTATHFGGSESGLIPEGYGAGSFSLTVTGLKPGNTYHLKTYVKVGGQIITSDEQLFTTPTTGATGKAAPTVLTDTANYTVSGNSITVSGEITDIGTSAVNVYGFVYAPHTAPFTGDDMLKTGDRAYAMWDKTPLYQGMKFTGTIRNIPPGKWYLRAYAHNTNQDSSADQPESLSYGQEISFTIACTPETCIPGDVNGDGKVSLDDAMLVLRILDGIPVGNVNLNADVNGDGRIGFEELGYILQKVAELRPSGT